MTSRSPAAAPAIGHARVASVTLCGIMVLALVPLAIETAAAPLRGDMAGLPFYLVFLLLPANLGAVGAVLTIRRPDNVIGWLLLVSGVLTGLTFACGEYERSAIAAGAYDWPLLVPAAWIASSWFIPAVGMLVVFLPLLYPTGRLPGPRWRWVAVAGIFGVAAGAIGPMVTPGPMADPRGPLNPLVPPEPLLTWIEAASTLSTVIAPPVFLLALASLLIRFRRSRGAERQQIKWFLFVAAVATLLFVVSMFDTGPVSDAAWALGLLTMAFLPLAIGFAILRYRLYDIDRLVSRAVGYALVTAILAATFGAAVIVAQAVLAPVTESSTLAVAASTLVVAGLFQPVRRAIQARVDRRFDRSRVNAERLVSTFGDTLRDVTDLPTIHDTMVATARTTWSPSAAAVWVRPRR
ncbi:MAG TPA: hypothetical protein VFQ75_04055 [Candidatus Limnocylindrales bacterium]|nr:hypothetical protein [Candidatus Limnocylindrales bacterium]